MQGDKGLALDIAHYNYELRFRSCGLFRGTQGFALRTYQGLLALWNLARGVTLPRDRPAQWHLPLRTLSRK